MSDTSVRTELSTPSNMQDAGVTRGAFAKEVPSPSSRTDTSAEPSQSKQSHSSALAAKVEVDLQVHTVKELLEATKKIKLELKRRRERVSQGSKLLKIQFNHIEEQLELEANQSSARSDNGIPKLSLEHLELYLRFLGRVDVDTLDSDLKVRRQKLIDRVEYLLDHHELKGEPRSGDVAGGEHGSAYFKVTSGRRRQMTVVLYFNLVLGPILTLVTIYLLWKFVPKSNILGCLYLAWMFYDNHTRKMPAPSRVKEWWRTSRIFEYFRDYFPIRLMKANQKSKMFGADKNFLFCYHPHGVQSAGAFSFSSAATGFDKIFPGLTASVQTLGINFKIPIMREVIISLGVGDASKRSILNALDRKKPGSCAVLVTGGAKESMEAHPYNSKLVLKDRKGFVKVAYRAGSYIVPVYGFGENNLYENLAIKSSRIRRWQRRIQKVLTFAPLLIAGRGVFSYSGGLIPHRRPISVVCGEPIPTSPLPKDPTNEELTKTHNIYKEKVRELFETYRDIYDPKAKDLEMI